MGEVPKTPALGHIRGSMLVHTHAHVIEKHGAGAWKRVVEAVPSGDRDQLGALLSRAGRR